jgi:hypothetical protein
MPSKDYLMLRSAQRARLEARTASLQLIFGASINFLTASKSGGPGGSRGFCGLFKPGADSGFPLSRE